VSRQEISIEIQQILDQLPDESLTAVLKYLKEVVDSAPSDFKQFNHLTKVLNEDANLLKRLAQ